MSEQPEALRIAEWFEGGYGGCESQAAAELRRLHKVNQELLEALRMWMHLHDTPAGYEGKYGKALNDAIAAQQVKIDAAANASRAAITKGEQA